MNNKKNLILYKKIIISFLSLCLILYLAILMKGCIHSFSVIKSNILRYEKKKQILETKEDMFQMLLENQTEYEDLVINLKSEFEKLDKKVLIIDYKKDYELYGLDYSLAEKYPIYFWGISSISGGEKINCYFKYPPNPYSYWGICYMENGEPPTFGTEKKMEEKDGVYTDIGSYYKFETEKITDNWYYFQCWTR